MTRAQIRIISKAQGLTFIYGVHSDGYPSRILPILKEFVGDISSFKDEFSLDPPGNPDYYYEIDCDKGIINSWCAVTYWRNAPDNWKERGWNCWQNDIYGKYGFTEWRKGPLAEKPIQISPTRIKLVPSSQYNHEDIKAMKQTHGELHGLLQILKRKTTTPDILHTYILASGSLHNALYDIPFEDIPIHINGPYKYVYAWRLTLGK